MQGPDRGESLFLAGIHSPIVPQSLMVVAGRELDLACQVEEALPLLTGWQRSTFSIAVSLRPKAWARV